MSDQVENHEDLFSHVVTHMSHLVGQPTMWFPNRSDTNRPVQLQKQAHTGKCKSTGAGCNELVQSKLRTGVRLKWRKR